MPRLLLRHAMASVLLVPLVGVGPVQAAPPGSAEFVDQSTDTLVALANSETPRQRAEALERALQRTTERLEDNAAAPAAVAADADAFGILISELAQDVAEDGDEALQRLVATATEHHIEVLYKVLTRVPDQAKPHIEGAIDASRKGNEVAVAALRGEPLPPTVGPETARGADVGSRPSSVPMGPPAGIGRAPSGFTGGGFGGRR